MNLSISRRNVLRLSAGAVVASASTGTALMWAADAQHDAAPAYRYWRQKDKGDLSDTAYMARCASLAPSAHNTQPWKFRLNADRIELYADRSRHLASADMQRRMMQLSLGCALENLIVAAQRLGYRAEVLQRDADQRFTVDGHCATVLLQRAAVVEHPWFDAIFERRTHRGPFHAAATLTPAFASNLSKLASDLPGIGLHWFEGEAAVHVLQDLVRASVRDFLTESRYRDGMAWFRITRDEWEQRRDGIAIFTSDAPAHVKRYVEWFATERDVLSAPFRQGEIDALDRVVAATPLWGLVHADQGSIAQRVQAGRLAERVYLEAAAKQLSVHPVCYPTEVDVHTQRLNHLAGLAATAEPLFLFRMGQATPVGHSVRRELSDLLII